ncbi:MAG: Holliday junction branch migration protein RuvA [Actinobacteria bacterium]|nr:Holliday junction branch migration protein RuvA [Actinomycetota bacterium]
MIAFVRGTVAQVVGDSLVIDLGSVGVTVQCTAATVLSVRHGEHIELMTSMVVREDGWTLYGFADPDERTVFEQVQTVSGIGPRIAMALLGSLGPDDLRRAVAADDEATVMRVPGIGRKGAQRLILELKDRIGPALGSGRVPTTTLAAGDWQAAVAAGLTSLGWSAREADQAIGAIDPESLAIATSGERPDVGALLKAALRTLDRS